MASTEASRQAEMTMWIGYYEGMIRSHDDLVTTLPTVTFEDSLVLSGTERRVILKAMPNGHSEGDLVLYLPDDRIAFMGDLLFVGRHPWLPDGNPDRHAEILRQVHEWNLDAVVPGSRIGEVVPAYDGPVHRRSRGGSCR